jgi:hypothetical protein
MTCSGEKSSKSIDTRSRVAVSSRRVTFAPLPAHPFTTGERRMYVRALLLTCALPGPQADATPLRPFHHLPGGSHVSTLFMGRLF